jgi:gamma-glutamylcyclotransferase (GGCT)/AIG2-like uncharacterized protein YtfP
VSELFVYGSLVPGGSYHDVVARFVERQRQAEVRGRLYDTGLGYPAARFDGAAATGTVRGVVLTLRPPAAEALAVLDGFEGPEYARVAVVTTGGERVETYEWIAPTRGLRPIPGGVWSG